MTQFTVSQRHVIVLKSGIWEDLHYQWIFIFMNEDWTIQIKMINISEVTNTKFSNTHTHTQMRWLYSPNNQFSINYLLLFYDTQVHDKHTPANLSLPFHSLHFVIRTKQWDWEGHGLLPIVQEHQTTMVDKALIRTWFTYASSQAESYSIHSIFIWCFILMSKDTGLILTMQTHGFC